MSNLIRHLKESHHEPERRSKTTIRIPVDVIDWLKVRAAENISSMTTELARVRRERMAQERRERAKGAAEVR
jgi:hypothetical protein